MISEITRRPFASATRRMSLSPSSPSPWNEYGEVRGLKAPPRRTRAPAARTAAAVRTIWSSDSIVQGPAMSTTAVPPISTSPIRSTVVSRRKLRLASLKGSGMGSASATPGMAHTSASGGSAPSPTAASTVGPEEGARTT